MRFFDKKFLKILLLGIILIFVYKFADSINYVVSWAGMFFEIISPIVFGAVIAFFIYKPVGKLENFFKKAKWGFIQNNARILGLLTIYLAIILLIGIAVNYIGPKLYVNIRELAKNMPNYKTQIEDWIAKSDFKIDDKWIDEAEKKIMSLFDAEKISQYITVVSNIANSFLSFFISVVISAYMILDKEDIFKFFRRVKNILFDNESTRVFVYYARKSVNLVYCYFSGLAFDAALMGIISAIVLSIFRVPYSVLLGVIIALGNLVPFFGAIVSNVVVYLIISLSFGPIRALWVLLFQFILGQVDGNLIQPKIVGNSVGISPLLVLISVTVFGGLFGAVGMVIGAPLMAVIRIIINDYLEKKKQQKLQNGVQ